MATYYLRTDGNDSNAGTSNTSGGAWRTFGKAASTVAAGDLVLVVGTAGNASSYPTSSLDYTIGSFFTPTAGSAASGRVKWIGLGSMPTVDCPGLAFYNTVFQWIEGIYFVATTNSNGGYGILNMQANDVVTGCILNLNNQASLVGINTNNGAIKGNEIYGGTASPTSSSGAYGIQVGNYSALIAGNRIRKCRDHGIYVSGAAADVRNNLIYSNVGDGININGAGVVNGSVENNTINGNSGHGISVASTNGAAWHTLRNNCITNHTQSGKAGINCATSSSDPRTTDWGYNNVWNNTSNYTNCSASSTDFSVDPGYANASTGDFTPSQSSLKAAFPTAF